MAKEEQYTVCGIKNERNRYYAISPLSENPSSSSMSSSSSLSANCSSSQNCKIDVDMKLENLTVTFNEALNSYHDVPAYSTHYVATPP